VLQGEFSVILALRGMYDPLILKGQQTEFLENCIRVYRLFIKLVLLPYLPKVYPTDSVDLVWHTHQLQGKGYKYQTRDMLGVFLDHRSFDELAPTQYVFNEDRDAWRAALKAAGLQDIVTNPPPEFVPRNRDDGPAEPSTGGHGSNCDCGAPGCGGKPPACGRSASQVFREESIFVKAAGRGSGGIRGRSASQTLAENAPIEQLRRLLGDVPFQ